MRALELFEQLEDAARRHSRPVGSAARHYARRLWTGRHHVARDGAEQRALRTTCRQLDAIAHNVFDHPRAFHHTAHGGSQTATGINRLAR
jgi:hypothetical protein